uniref:Uncharacterized protein n=1 Tax=Timema bartmani TaxID=61472 RepID=A0A7R9EUI3_9NEOP|nr:unnamed protein product [Timema bartmani]
MLLHDRTFLRSRCRQLLHRWRAEAQRRRLQDLDTEDLSLWRHLRGMRYRRDLIPELRVAGGLASTPLGPSRGLGGGWCLRPVSRGGRVLHRVTSFIPDLRFVPLRELSRALARLKTSFAPGLDRTQAILFTHWGTGPLHPLRVEDATVQWSQTVWWLGVTLDARCSWDPHLRSAASKARDVMVKQAPLLQPVSPLAYGHKIRLFCSIITHSAPVFSYLPRYRLNHFRAVYHWFLHLILGASPRIPNRVLLTMSGLPSLDSRICGLAERFFSRPLASSNQIVRGIGDYDTPAHQGIPPSQGRTSGSMVVVITYQAELQPPHNRGAAICSMQIFWVLGTILRAFKTLTSPNNLLAPVESTYFDNFMCDFDPHIFKIITRSSFFLNGSAPNNKFTFPPKWPLLTKSHFVSTASSLANSSSTMGFVITAQFSHTNTACTSTEFKKSGVNSSRRLCPCGDRLSFFSSRKLCIAVKYELMYSTLLNQLDQRDPKYSCCVTPPSKVPRSTAKTQFPFRSVVSSQKITTGFPSRWALISAFTASPHLGTYSRRSWLALGRSPEPRTYFPIHDLTAGWSIFSMGMFACRQKIKLFSHIALDAALTSFPLRPITLNTTTLLYQNLLQTLLDTRHHSDARINQMALACRACWGESRRVSDRPCFGKLPLAEKPLGNNITNLACSQRQPLVEGAPLSRTGPTTMFLSWRFLVVLSVVPPILLVLVIVTFLPESPRYLLTRGKVRSTLKSLQTIFAMNTGMHREKYPKSYEFIERERKSVRESIGLLLVGVGHPVMTHNRWPWCGDPHQVPHHVPKGPVLYSQALKLVLPDNITVFLDHLANHMDSAAPVGLVYRVPRDLPSLPQPIFLPDVPEDRIGQRSLRRPLKTVPRHQSFERPLVGGSY